MTPIFAHGQGLVLVVDVVMGLAGLAMIIAGWIFHRSPPDRVFAKRLVLAGVVALLLSVLLWPPLKGIVTSN